MLAGEDDDAAEREQQIAGEEGLPLDHRVSVSSSLTVAPVFDDSTIYTSYSRLNNGTGLVTPHSLLETRWTEQFQVHQEDLPPITGFFQLRNAQGSFSVPSLFQFLPENTYDYILGGGPDPVVHFGRDFLAFQTGLAFTVRRDLASPVALNQDLFRQYLYVQSSPFWNLISVHGAALHEAGPFTSQTLSSRDLVGNLEFKVGRPWGKTALLTGYAVRDLLFHPRHQEWFQTATYLGIQRQFGKKLTMAVLGQDVRAWAVLNRSFGAAQMVEPAIRIDYRPAHHWEVNGNFAVSRGQGEHAYDNMQSGFYISYTKPLRRNVDSGTGPVPVDYPLQLSFGMEEQDFYNFTGHGQGQYAPVFRLTLF